jgi:peptide/nickel transport system permease protein
MAVVVVLATAIGFLLLRGLRPDLFPDGAALLPYLEGVFLHFDFGTSRAVGRPAVADAVREGIGADAVLFAGGLTLGLLGGLLGGAFAAGRGRGAAAWSVQAVALVAFGAPVFVVGLSALLLFGDGIGVVGPGAVIPLRYVPISDGVTPWLRALIAPWVVLALPLAGLLLRSMYGATREALAEEPVRTALAKGVSPRRSLLRHAAPLGAGPALSLVGATANITLLNLALVERVFNVPGVFAQLPQAVATGDAAVLLALTAVGAAFVALTALVSDVLLAVLDPRIR